MAAATGQHAPRGRSRVVDFRRRENSPNALEEVAACGGDAEHRPAFAQLLERRQRAGVDHAIRADGNDDVVAAELTFNADAARQPPDRRVVEEQRLDRALEQVDQIVVPPNVRQLVRKDRVELRRREPRQHAGRNDNRRTDPADERRHVDERATATARSGG